MAFDATLIKRMEKGEQQAFGQCYEQLAPLIYSVVLRVCHCKTSAQDIVQESFIQGFSSLDKLHQHDKFVPWLKRIAFNHTISWIRKHHKHLVSCEDYDVDNVVDDGAFKDLERSLASSNLLAKLMLGLTPDARLILWMFVVEGYSHQEIGDLYGKSVSYSKTIVSRTLGTLRAETKEDKYVQHR